MKAVLYLPIGYVATNGEIGSSLITRKKVRDVRCGLCRWLAYLVTLFVLLQIYHSGRGSVPHPLLPRLGIVYIF